MNAPVKIALSQRDIERFWARVTTATDGDACWQWRGYISEKGYGMVHAGGNTRPAHRVSYLIHRGDIPGGLVIDHLCRNRSCVNPKHLEAVTNTENLLRSELTIPGAMVRRTHCPAGHVIDGRKGVQRNRYCTTCSKARKKARREKAAA